MIGAYLADGAGNANPQSGDRYVIFGGPSLPSVIGLPSLGSAGISIYGVDGGDRGAVVGIAGDVNGDGFDDLLVGTDRGDGDGNARSESGESHLIFGSADPPESIHLATLGAAGVTFYGADQDDQHGYAVGSAGDINGDGLDDLIVSSPGADAAGNAKPEAGESYIVFGSTSWPADIDLSSLGDAGITIEGAERVTAVACRVAKPGRQRRRDRRSDDRSERRRRAAKL